VSCGGGAFNGASNRTFIKNRLVAENNDVKLAVCNKAIENIPAWLASGFDIECAYADDT
jgi:hypothetical protein